MYGLGQVTSSTDTTGAPCPGSPGCPGYVAPGSMDYQSSLLQEILANQGTGAPAASQTLSQWLNANATTVAIGAGVVLLLVVLGKGGR